MVSNSWGLDEWSGETAYDSSTFVTPSGHTGVTFLTASNDNGANVYPSPPSDPAAVRGKRWLLSRDLTECGVGRRHPTDPRQQRLWRRNRLEFSGSGEHRSTTAVLPTLRPARGHRNRAGSAAPTARPRAGAPARRSGRSPSRPRTRAGEPSCPRPGRPAPSNATNATYTIYDGTQASGTILGTVVVNQSEAPAGTAVGGSQFQELGVFFPTLTSSGTGTLTVVLNASSANSRVVADAIGRRRPGQAAAVPLRSNRSLSYQLPFQNTRQRTTPDVAFDASENTGVTCFQNGSLTYGNFGTSLSSPCWAGLIAIANQGRVADGGTTFNSGADPTQTLQALYSLPASDFHDITSGYNGFNAGPGYDEVTGLGSPIANLLIPGLVSLRRSDPVGTTGDHRPAARERLRRGVPSGSRSRSWIPPAT